MSNQIQQFSTEVIAAAKENPSLEPAGYYSATCDCAWCDLDRDRIKYLVQAQAITEATVASVSIETPAAAPLTRRDELLAIFAARGITPIPDDEITDRGDYLLWDKYDPNCTLILDAREAEGYLDTLDTYKLYYGSVDTILARRLRAYPSDKPVRVKGVFRFTDRYGDSVIRYLLPTTGAQRHFTVSQNSSYVDSRGSSSSMDLRTESKVERVTMQAIPREARSSLAEHVTRHLASEGRVPSVARSQVEQRWAAMASIGQGVNPYAKWRDAYLSQFKDHRQSLRELGAMIRDAENTNVDDVISHLNDCEYGGNITERAIEVWNERCSYGDELTAASCGHVCLSGESHDTRDGEVCDSCFEDNYVYVENTEDHRHRDNVYLHSDDCYYTYEEEYDEDDEDEDAEEDEGSCGGRIKNYSTNVLDYWGADRTITPSIFGEFHMGIELEVVPKRGCRADAAEHTAANLCDGYAIMKNDGSLDSGGFEIVTAPRGVKEHVERFTKWKPHSSLRAWDPGCCGMHVHISSKAFSQGTLGKFIEFINAPENDAMILSIAGRTPTRDTQAQSYCQREGRLHTANPKKTVTGKSSSRYHMVNTSNMSHREAERLGLAEHDCNKSINTVELRIFRASLKKARLLAQIEFAHAAVMFCRWSSMRELREEHFKAWLRKSAGIYPNLAKWFGVRANTTEIVAAPKVQQEAEV